jgi:hypothetical protein
MVHAPNGTRAKWYTRQMVQAPNGTGAKWHTSPQPPSWSNEVVVDAVAVLEAPLEVEALLDRHPPSGVVSYISAQPSHHHCTKAFGL